MKTRLPVILILMKGKSNPYMNLLKQRGSITDTAKSAPGNSIPAQDRNAGSSLTKIILRLPIRFIWTGYGGEQLLLKLLIKKAG